MRSFFSHCFPSKKPRHQSHPTRTATTLGRPATDSLTSNAQQRDQPQPPTSTLKVDPGSGDVAPPRSQSRSRTSLLDTGLFEELGSLEKKIKLEPMADELVQLKKAVKRMRSAEAACDHLAGRTERAQRLDELEQARQHLLTRVRRTQMVLQGHRQNLDVYHPNLRQVSHLGSCKNNWLRLERARKSLEAAPVQPPP